MPATREALIARWETEEGKTLAEEALQAIRSPAGSRPGPIQLLDAAFLQRLQALPFVAEVAPQIDLRGLHLENRVLDFNERDLSGVRLDYAFPINLIMECRVNGAIFDNASSVYGSFLQEDLQGISLVGHRSRRDCSPGRISVRHRWKRGRKRARFRHTFSKSKEQTNGLSVSIYILSYATERKAFAEKLPADLEREVIPTGLLHSIEK